MIKRLIKARNKPRFPVYRQVGGYRAWKDKKPPRQDSLGRLLIMIALIGVVLLVPCGGIGWYSNQRVTENNARRTQAAQMLTAQSTPAIREDSTVEITPEATADEPTAESTLEAADDLILPTATLTPIPIRLIVTESSPTPGSSPTLTPYPIRAISTASRVPTLLQTLHALQTGTPTARAFPTLPLAQPSTARPVAITPQSSGGGGSYPVEIVVTVPPVIIVETVIVIQPPVIETVIVYPTSTPAPELTEESTEEPTVTPTDPPPPESY